MQIFFIIYYYRIFNTKNFYVCFFKGDILLLKPFITVTFLPIKPSLQFFFDLIQSCTWIISIAVSKLSKAASVRTDFLGPFFPNNFIYPCLLQERIIPFAALYLIPRMCPHIFFSFIKFPRVLLFVLLIHKKFFSYLWFLL